MLHDAAGALRSLSRTPWLAAAIVLSLAIGSGATAAVYSAVDALLFRPPAGVNDAERLVEVYTSQMTGGTYGASSYPDYLSIAGSPQLAAAAVIDERDEATVRLGDATTLRRVAAVSANFWNVLGGQPHLGVWPDPAANRPGVVLGFEAWQALGAPADITGRQISIDDDSYVVAAVTPARFRGLHIERVLDVWTPLDADALARGDRHLKIIGRLHAGTTLDQLQSHLTATAHQLAEAYPETNKGTIRSPDAPRRFTARMYSRLNPAVRTHAALLSTILLAVTGLLLVSACVNAGSLLLSRGIARRAELTIRTALGADRPRLVRQVVVESVILVLVAAAGGLLVATWVSGSIPALFAPEHAALIDVRVRPAVMFVALVTAAVVGVLCGLAPAILATRSLAIDILRGDPAGVGERHGGAGLRMTLVAAQLALSTVCLLASGLLTRAVDAALVMDRSWSPERLAIASIESYDPEYRNRASAQLRIPAIGRVGWVAALPVSRSARRQFRITRSMNQEFADFDVNFASTGYFSVMAMRLVEGRLFHAQDDAPGAAVAMVNEALAERYFPDRAVGRQLTDTTGQTVEIVGVVRTRSYRAFEGPVQPMVYYPMSRWTARGYFAVVRSSDGGAEAIEEELLATLQAVGNVKKVEVFTFETHLARALAADRLIVTLVATCGAIALALALMGVYGVMADMIGRRTREIGLRLALGAAPRHIVSAFAGNAVRPMLAGIGAGVFVAATMVQVGRSIVFGLPPLDVALTAGVASALSVSVLAAVAPPVRRALRVSPLRALHTRA